MLKIKCLIVDDEPLAVQLIEHHVASVPFLEVAATAPNAIKAFELLANNNFDLMFLDIKMPHLTGIDFLKSIKNPPKTIITTAYRDFAIESFELEAVDYLLKPITFDRFLKAVERVTRHAMTTPKPVATLPLAADKTFVILKSGAKSHKVMLDNILYIESLKDYIKVVLEEGKNIVSKHKISDIEAELAEAGFIRVHRSFIVNGQKIKAFTATDIEVGAATIPIGALYKAQLDEHLV